MSRNKSSLSGIIGAEASRERPRLAGATSFTDVVGAEATKAYLGELRAAHERAQERRRAAQPVGRTAIRPCHIAHREMTDE